MLKQPKALTKVGDYKVEYLLAGEGNPTIVLINGGEGPIEGWYKILPALAAASTTLAYNRAGVGRTSKPAHKQTSDLIVAQLRGLLRSLGLSPPYLLVGHSLGGLHANFFARAYPREVCGLVLLEATAPQDIALMAASHSPLQRRLQRISNLLFDRQATGEAFNAPISVSMVQTAGAFPTIPVAVISGGAIKMPKEVKSTRLHNQKNLSKLSSEGRHVIAKRSGHFPQFSEPELVTATVLDLLFTVRAQAQLEV